MRQAEQDIGMVGTAGKPPSVNSTAGNTQVVSTLTTIDTTTSHHKTKPTPQDSFEESSVHEVENNTTSSSTPGEEGNQKIRRKPSRVGKHSFSIACKQ